MSENLVLISRQRMTYMLLYRKFTIDISGGQDKMTTLTFNKLFKVISIERMVYSKNQFRIFIFKEKFLYNFKPKLKKITRKRVFSPTLAMNIYKS